jgi:hypothetical protein
MDVERFLTATRSARKSLDICAAITARCDIVGMLPQFDRDWLGDR